MVGFKRFNRFVGAIKTDELTKSALILACAGIISKCVGAVYRLLLTSVAGAEALGIYQTVFPLYCVLLTFSSTGVPSGISKLVAEGENDKKLAYKSIILFGSIGFIGSLAMIKSANFLAVRQGEGAADIAYKCLAPSVFLVSVISVLRGVFQGKMNMVPTAVSQIIEQTVKAVVGVLLCLLGKTPAQKAALAAFAVTVSEFFALLFLVVASRQKTRVFERERKNEQEKQAEQNAVAGMQNFCAGEQNKHIAGERTFTLNKPLTEKRKSLFSRRGELSYYKKIISIVLPVTLSALALPLLRLADSFTVVNLLRPAFSDATGLYGLYTGGAESVVSLPVSVCYGLAAAAVPLVAHKKSVPAIKSVLSKTFVLSAFFSLAVVLFAPLAVRILFYSVSPEYQNILVNLLRFSCLNVVFLSMIQSLAAVLIALGKPFVSFVNVLAVLPLKLVLNYFLVGNPSVGVYGCAFSDTACFFVAGFLNLLYIIYCKK